MARELWAKVAVELLDDGKMFGRPDYEWRLWVSLILFCKATSDDGFVRGLTADGLRGKFGLHCRTKDVTVALVYFSETKPEPMVRLYDDGAIELLKYKTRQARPKDSPEAALERKRRERERNRHGEVTEEVPVTEPVTTRDNTRDNTRDATRDGAVTTCDNVTQKEREKKIEKEKEKREENLSSSSFPPQVARASQTDATPTEQAKLKHALGTDHKPRRDQRGPAEIRDLVGGVAAVANAAVAKREGT